MRNRLIASFSVWRVRRAAGILMAKAAYERLEQAEQNHLEHLCRAYPELEAERDKYVAFARNFRLATDELPFDLSARINAALATPSAPGRQRRALVYAAAAALLATGLYMGVMLFDNTPTANNNNQIANTAVSNPEPATVRQAADTHSSVMKTAAALVDNNDFIGAVTLLERFIAADPHDPEASEALLLLADIEYSCLQRYDQAFAAYDAVYANYPDDFESSADCWMRYGLLAESHKESYAPLYALESARKHSGDTFSIFENIASLYPTTMLANKAVEEMCALMKRARRNGQTSIADTLELVRTRCSDPVAMALVDLTLGHIYAIANERECAEASYRSVAAGGHIALANQAYLALENME